MEHLHHKGWSITAPKEAVGEIMDELRVGNRLFWELLSDQAFFPPSTDFSVSVAEDGVFALLTVDGKVVISCNEPPYPGNHIVVCRKFMMEILGRAILR